MRHSVHIGLNQPSHLCDSLEAAVFLRGACRNMEVQSAPCEVYSVFYP